MKISKGIITRFTHNDGRVVRVFMYSTRKKVRQYFFTKMGHWQYNLYDSFKGKWSRRYFMSSDLLPIKSLLKTVWLNYLS